ncbi:MAG: U32 family peptidase [Candidatus Lokiarchaeota archaeon]|nr:U32 family peptidase [Candidatus Lokiarchaeota archaeon]
MESRPELLVPVQNWNSLEFVKDLADAIYFGVQNFNMRIKAKNFNRTDLNKVVDFCHNQDPPMRTYLTTNILIYDSELQDLENLISEAKESGIDAIIAHDIAAIRIAKKNNIEFHISTQANVSNIETAKFFEELGAERIILARELSLKQIRLIKQSLTKTKIECFIHGSMCTSISGRCYFSATIGNSEKDSANRGNCTQPCRREWRVIDDEKNEFIYDGQMFLNAKDLCMIEYIPELIEAKIDAFKIEGRMKDPLYIKTVCECYKEALDAYFNNTYSKEKIKIWVKRLSSVFNRGFHTGFYFHKPTIEDIELEKRGNVSPYKKHYIGKVLSYDENSKSANVLLESLEIPLRIGDEIIIEGSETYLVETIRKMIYKGEKIKSIARKRYTDPVKINLRLNKGVNSNDRIFILVKD